MKGRSVAPDVLDRRTTEIQISKWIGQYLEECRMPQHANGGRVSLGALPGFPTYTDDPEVVDKAVATIEARMRANSAGAVRELRLQQRVLDLRDAANRLRMNGDNGGGDNLEARFVKHAADWASKNGIGYRAFRAMGVPARALKAAGLVETRAQKA